MKWVLIVVLIIGIVIVFGLAAVTFQYLSLFHSRTCKHCGAFMEYKGEKECKEGNIFLFHCPKCGVLEEVPVDKINE